MPFLRTIVELSGVTRTIEQPIQQLGQSKLLRGLTQVGDQRAEARQRPFAGRCQRRMLLDTRKRVERTQALVLGPALEFGESLRTDLAVGHVDDPLQRHLVLRIGDQAQIGQHVLDLFALVELLAADHHVRCATAHELLSQRARLRIGAIHNRALPQAGLAASHQPANLVDDVGRLFVFVVRLMDGDLRAPGALGPQALVLAAGILADHALRGVENHLRRAIVLLEKDDARAGKVLLHLQQDAWVGAAPAIDRVMGDDPIRDEIVRSLDVQVVDRRIEGNRLNPLDDIVSTFGIKHDHPGAHRRRRQERQRFALDDVAAVLPKRCVEDDVSVDCAADAFSTFE